MESEIEHKTIYVVRQFDRNRTDLFVSDSYFSTKENAEKHVNVLTSIKAIRERCFFSIFEEVLR